MALHTGYRLRGEQFVRARRCNMLSSVFSKVPSDWSVLPKNSASDSVVLSARIVVPRDDTGHAFNRDVIIKATLPDLEHGHTHVAPLAAERELYAYVTDLVRARVTPNLVAMYGAYDCTMANLWTDLPFDTYTEMSAEVSRIYAKYGRLRRADRSDSVRLLILERASGLSLHKWLLELHPTEESVFSVLFQILYTLHILNRRGVRHADLHVGNIIIERLPADVHIDYFPERVDVSTDEVLQRVVPRTFYRVPVRHFARLYDWDWGGAYEEDDDDDGEDEAEQFEFGAMTRTWLKRADRGALLVPAPTEPIVNDIAVDYCARLSTCARNERADAYTVLSGLYKLVRNSARYAAVKQFIERAVDVRLLQFGLESSVSNFDKSGGFPHRLCAGPIDASTCPAPFRRYMTNERCHGPWDPPDCWMRTPSQMLQLEPFAQWYRQVYPRQRPQPGDYVFGDWANEHSRRIVTAPSTAPRAEHAHQRRLAAIGV